MRIAILGAGFAGLATTWFLLHYSHGSVTIDLYDPLPIGSGSSGISSGLLHPYAGKHANLSWKADRGMKETHRLLTVASQAINKPLILSKGILRPAFTEEQVATFQKQASNYDDLEWWDQKKSQEAIDGLSLPNFGGGLYVKNGLTIDVPEYLQGLWRACALFGTQYHPKALITENELAGYDAVLIALGASALNFLALKNLPITPVKGQIITLNWPEKMKPLPLSLVGPSYLVMGKDGKTCHAGATFERDFANVDPDPKFAYDEIMKKILPYFPALSDSQIIDCKAGVRASTKNHLPLVGRISQKIWFFTGLGSKGLLYHAWVGKRMALSILNDSKDYLPRELLSPGVG